MYMCVWHSMRAVPILIGHLRKGGWALDRPRPRAAFGLSCC
uniref:Uncharacterized protein n=1 Tax=Anguilla anguilla TaxID=7936 RepID=A0A0E9XGE5_ANGAN